MSGKVTFTLSLKNDDHNAYYSAEISQGATWSELLDDVILPGLRAMGYLVDREDIE